MSDTNTTDPIFLINLTIIERELLLRLMRSSTDDPRIHGLIGTCFWSQAHTKEEEGALKSAWTSLQKKVNELPNAVELY
jgi:hypothetical protein